MKRVPVKQGFTLLELLIATLVFSVVLLLCMVGVNRLGQLYYKGITMSRTQELTRQLSDEFISQLQFGKGNIQVSQQTNNTNGGTPFVVCIGDARYQINPNRELGVNATSVLLKQTNFDCSSSSWNDLTPSSWSSAVELTSKNMRISRFNISSNTSGLWTVDIKVTSGDEDLIQYPGGTTSDAPSEYQNVTCKLGSGGQFCATSQLTTTVLRRING